MNGREWEMMYRQERREALKAKGRSRTVAEREQRRRKRVATLRGRAWCAGACLVVMVDVGAYAWNHRSVPAKVEISYQGCHQEGSWTVCNGLGLAPKPDPARWFNPRYWGATNDTSNADFPARITSDGRRTYEVRDLMGRSI